MVFELFYKLFKKDKEATSTQSSFYANTRIDEGEFEEVVKADTRKVESKHIKELKNKTDTKQKVDSNFDKDVTEFWCF